ncbi:hypothetical protein YQE_06853, partial [Dendroctonus ponderosae]
PDRAELLPLTAVTDPIDEADERPRCHSLSLYQLKPAASMTINNLILRFYKHPGFTPSKQKEVLVQLQKVSAAVEELDTELCYHVEVSKPLSSAELKTLQWILQDSLTTAKLSEKSLVKPSANQVLIEVGPRFNFSTAYSTNAVSICQNVGLSQIVRLEVSRRYLLNHKPNVQVAPELFTKLASSLFDRMTECLYTPENLPKNSFNEKLKKKENIKEIDILQRGADALKEIDRELGLAFDEADLAYYTNLFKNVLKRNPTNIECFDLAQSNSEHSRHWFFKGKMIVDGVEYEESLIDMIIETQKHSNPNNVIKFSDNSSAIRGYIHRSLRPASAGSVSELRQVPSESHLIFTAETHNFPTGVAPFSGATTGTGGRIRDVQSVGRGGYCIAGTAGYSVGNCSVGHLHAWNLNLNLQSLTGNLHIPDYQQPWEDENFQYPSNFASPLEVLIQASNGASDYGNKFGEPLISGFVRSFGLHDATERSGGIGSMEADMTEKLPPEIGHQIVKIGGPVYRIGVGGGAASSVEVQGDNKEELDFNAVQRGDAEMENKLNRVVRACLELGKNNPIISIHDQGAGGNGNVLKELVEPAGGTIYANRFELGDPTINLLELWGAEYQENNALLCAKSNLEVLRTICQRERQLDHVLGKMPRKVFKLERKTPLLKHLKLPTATSIYHCLEKVLRLPSVGSKRYLTNKVDRCVTGLIAQQQCVGPLHTPLADVAVTAISHFGYEGIASSIGEQPIKGLINVEAGARMSVVEAISNLVFAGITDLKDVKCSGNWMWAAKLPGEGAALYDACKAMCSLMSELGIAVDGGKDSLSMAARAGKDTVKAPGTLVISTYAPCPDIRKVITPDFKAPSMGKQGVLLFVDISRDANRLGGSALAQCCKQLGNNVPDLHSAKDLKNAFAATQELIKDGAVLAGHDVSDGGLIVTLLEMCFAGMSGMKVHVKHRQGKPIEVLYSEEVGWVLEVLEKDVGYCMSVFQGYHVPVFDIGRSVGYGIKSEITIAVNNATLESTVLPLMRRWEETSYRLELRQTIKECADSEFASLATRTGPKYLLTFDPDFENVFRAEKISVAVIREEGINSDREMAAALVRVGFKVWDVTMQDLLTGAATLNMFRGVIFPGGFSYADVMGSGKGWAASILFHDKVKEQFTTFFNRPDTFSLGVCNGCQLMALIGWVGTPLANEFAIPDITLEHNKSERFECRWSTVRIEKSQAIMLKDMEKSVLGVWVAHGEGRFAFKDNTIYNKLVKDGLVALRYVDDNSLPTEVYPMNPNGSLEGLAGVCSPNGRHLAIMPHPERCVQPFQCPYMPREWIHYQKSPWEKMFKNAFDWCTNNKCLMVYH